MIRSLIPTPRYYGWRIVGAGALCSALSSPGQSFVFSLYLDDFIRDAGVSRVGISSVYAAATVAAALCLPFVGRAADRTTTRAFLSGVVAAMAGALVLLSLVRSWWMLAGAFFLLRLLGQGAIGLGTLTATVRWFQRYRARTLAMVGFGYSIGEMSSPASCCC